MTSRHRQEFIEGAKKSVPVVVASAPFGMLFGVVAVQNGFSVGEATFMSAIVYAGASQMVGLELFGKTIAPWVIVLSIFAVNFRHILYSAALSRHVMHWKPWQRATGFFFMTDPQYGETERRSTSGPVTYAWYMGMGVPVYFCWVAEGFLGAAFGNLIPNPYAIGLDFLLPIYFLGMVMDFRKRPLWLPIVAASSAASIAAYYTVGSPWHVSIGALAGILLAAAIAPIKKEGAR
jgi:predicted branched-subunit amino acid permease